MPGDRKKLRKLVIDEAYTDDVQVIEAISSVKDVAVESSVRNYEHGNILSSLQSSEGEPKFRKLNSALSEMKGSTISEKPILKTVDDINSKTNKVSNSLYRHIFI